MKNLYKCCFALIFSGITLITNAQDLLHKVPADAVAVCTIKGKNLTDLMSLKEFSSTFIGKEILAKLSKESPEINSFDNIGFNLSANFYYYYQSNDSVSYNCFMAPVKDAKQIESLFNKGIQNKVISKGDLRSFYNEDSTQVAHWNNEVLLFVVGKAKPSYFNQPAVRSRLGLESLDINTNTVTVDTVSVDMEVDDEVDTASTSTSEDEVMVESATPMTIAPYFSANDKRQISIVAKWVEKTAVDFFSGKSGSSILSNPGFVKSIDEQAEASIWVSGADKLVNGFMPGMYNLRGINFLSGYGAMNAKLYLEKQAIKVSTAITFNDSYANAFKKIYKAKVNKQFLKYINEDQMIGYMAYAINTKAYLQEYPKLMQNMFGNLYADEIDMATDLFSLLLDEEAIGKVVKGDGLFVFNGLSQKEMSFKSYEYNEENFETKEVTKTKMETLPDFLLMLSTEDTRLLDKLIAYGTKKQLIKQKSGYIELSIPKTPIALFAAINGGILFFSTNETEMNNIVSGKFVSKVSSENKKLINSSNYSAYFSAKKLSGKIPGEETGNSKQLGKINTVLNSMGNMYVKSYPIKGSTLSGELRMDVPSNQQNALKYLFDIIENAQK